MEKQKGNSMMLDFIEYASALAAAGFLFIGLNSYYQSGGEPNVLGASDVAEATAQQMTIGGLPAWAAVTLAALLIMGIVVLTTVVLSHGTIKRLKRG
jgi:NADPH-dependent 2,4-dienoyl-CoA reductase/sulfur reductase-like enzyme